MAYVNPDYATEPSASTDQWVCTRTSNLGPFKTIPPEAQRKGPDFCGQCVSYVTTVCKMLPVNTGAWKKGSPVKGNAAIAKGTAIATFDTDGKYKGHAAIYAKQDDTGIHVIDQWVTGAGKPIGPRVIKWEGTGVANKGSGYYVID